VGHPFLTTKLKVSTEVIGIESESGEYLGRSVLRSGFRTGFKLGKVQETWALQYWEPIHRAMEIQPFFWAWDATRYPDDGYCCHTDKRAKDTKSDKPIHTNIEVQFTAK
jgi:hypothetical protein